MAPVAVGAVVVAEAAVVVVVVDCRPSARGPLGTGDSAALTVLAHDARIIASGRRPSNNPFFSFKGESLIRGQNGHHHDGIVPANHT